MSIYQKYLCFTLSVLASHEATCMRRVTSRTGAQVGRALSADALSAAGFRQFADLMRAAQSPDQSDNAGKAQGALNASGQLWTQQKLVKPRVGNSDSHDESFESSESSWKDRFNRNAFIKYGIGFALFDYLFRNDDDPASWGFSKERALEIQNDKHAFEAMGYQTFYHGRAWKWNFANDMWNIICATKKNEANISDEVSLRHRPGKQNVDSLKKLREDTMNNADFFEHQFGLIYHELFFMNKTLGANKIFPGECSGRYFVDGVSCKDDYMVLEKIEEVFKKSGLGRVYRSNKESILSLYDLHKQSSASGELLAVSIDKNYVNQMVYKASVMGLKNDFTEFEFLYPYNNLISNLIGFLPFSINPVKIYCFAVPGIPGESGALGSGAKYCVKSYNMADPEKYAQYTKERDQLFAKMKKQYDSSWWSF